MKLQYCKANWGIFLKRIGAYLIDYAIALLGILVFVFVFSFFPAVLGDMLSYAVLILIFPIYYVVMFAKYGQTLGYKVLKLKLVQEDGSAITYKIAVYRLLLSIVSSLVLSLGNIMILFDEKQQAFHDYKLKLLVKEGENK